MLETATAHSQQLLRTGGRARMWQFVLRHPASIVAMLAFGVRMLVAIGMSVLDITDPVQDDEVYVDIVRADVDGVLGSLDPYYQELFSSVWAFTEPLSLVGKVFGVHVLSGQVIIALWASLAAAATTMIGLRVLRDRRLALFAGLVPALLPSQVLWSSVWLKDAAVSAALSTTVLGVIIAMRAPGRRARIVGCALGLGALLILSGLRLNSFVLACWCVAIVLAAYHWRRPLILAATVLGLVIVPWIGGAGVLGRTAVAVGDDLGNKRAAGASNAESALIRPPPPTSSGEPRPPRNDVIANLRYLPTGLAAVLVRPLPWERSTSSSSTFAKVDNLLWYPILVAAFVGLWLGRRRREIVLIGLLTAFTVGVYALAEGNLGTAFRHRGEVVWGAALLACLAIDLRLRRRRTVSATGTSEEKSHQ